MFLGQKVYTRGQDVREYRLFLLIEHLLNGRLPSERAVGALFQTTATQSRALLRAVMSKYQYDLQVAIHETLKDAVGAAVGPVGSRTITIESENVIDALNQRIAARDGTLSHRQEARYGLNL